MLEKLLQFAAAVILKELFDFFSFLYYRAISIDFPKMRVLRKTNIKVRRMSSKDTEWLWYYRGDHSWYQYGDKVSFTLMDMTCGLDSLIFI